MDLSEKELLLLEAYRTASSTEKQRVESILKVHRQIELEELRKQEWSDKSIGGMLMELLGMDKEQVSRLTRSLSSRQMKIISAELAIGTETSLQKVKEMFQPQPCEKDIHEKKMVNRKLKKAKIR